MSALMIFGVICLSRLGVSQLPDADFPVLNISATLSGAAPEVIENTIVDPLEEAMTSIEGVTTISSSAKTGSANISLEFDLGKNIDVALQDVQAKLAQAQRRLPTDMETPVISKSNPDDQPIIWLALTGKNIDLKTLNRIARDQVKDRFSSVPGIGEIFLGGYTAPALRVWVKPEALSKYNMTVNDVIDALKTEHVELPGGQIETNTRVINVRTLGEAKNKAEFDNIIISRRAGAQVSDQSQPVRLKDVANIEEGLDEIRRIARFNGEMALGLGIRKQRGSNAVAVARGIKDRLVDVQKDLPPGVELNVNFDSTRFIEASVHELKSHLFLAALLTSLVCWMFLGSWSATFNVLLAIPTSILGAFIGLYFFGFTLNTFTLLGLTLAIGIVVDDAIMVLENIFRFKELGHSKIKSAILGSREIAFAALAATAAVIAIFLPVAFMKGVIGVYFMQFGVTISLAVFLSLVESLTITPMRCASFISEGHRTTRIGKAMDKALDQLTSNYAKWLKPTLNNPWKVLIASLVFLIASFLLVKKIPKEFTPTQDQSLFIARLQLPVGSSLQQTNEKSQLVEKWLQEQKEVKQIFASAGGFGGGSSDSNTGMIFVSLVPKADRKISQQDFMTKTRAQFKDVPDLKVNIQDLSARGFSSGRGFQVEFMVQGGDWDELWSSTKKLMDEMEKSGMMVDVDSNYLLGMPEIQIRPDREQANNRGVTVSNIAQTINSLIGGVRVGQYSKDGRRDDIRLQILRKPEVDNQSGSLKDDGDKNARPYKIAKDEINQLLVGNNRGNLISLNKLVQQTTEPSLQQISRVNRQRTITVSANLNKGFTLPQAQAFIDQKSKEILKPGYVINQSGNSKAFGEFFTQLAMALGLGILVAYMVLATQFNSFIDPISILLSMPYSISGAFMALLVTGQSLNLYSMIGILLLMGIVKKNAILLIEFANQLRESEKLNAKDALLKAGPIRLRPILMTSLATVAGAIPSALALGEGSEAFRPMAITIIGGVLVSTVLTLFVVPVGSLLMEKFRSKEQKEQETKKAFEEIEAAAIS